MRLERHLWAHGSSSFPAAIQQQAGDAAPRPLSAAQRLTWRRTQLYRGNPVANAFLALRIRGPLDLAALERSIAEVLRRHEVLRTAVAVVDGEPVQVVRELGAVEVPVTALAGNAGAERNPEAQVLALAAARRPFDPTTGPLVRTELLRTAEQEHLLLLTMHEVVADAWSRGIVFNDLAALYRSFAADQPAPLPALPLRFADVAAWHQERGHGEGLAAERAFWRRRLADAPPGLALPTDRPRPTEPTFSGARQPLALSVPLSDALKDLGRQEGVSPFVTLLAAWQALLGRIADQEDFLVAAPVSGRVRPGTEGVVGPLANTLPLRADLSGDPTFRELLGRTRQLVRRAYAHQEFPFTRLVEELRPDAGPAGEPWPRVAFGYHRPPRAARVAPDVVFDVLDVDPRTAEHDLSWEIHERAGALGGWLEYGTELFDAATIRRLAQRLLALLERIVAHPDHRLSELVPAEGPRPAEAIRLDLPLQPNEPRAGSVPPPAADAPEALLRDAWAPTPLISLVPLQPNGTQRPLFIVPGGLGTERHAARLGALGRRLGPDRPVYGFLAQGVEGVGDPEAWGTAVIAGYLDALRDRQPHGPYLLCGICGGGYFAFELAQQLLAHGEQVAGLVLVDVRHPDLMHPDRDARGRRSARSGRALPAYRAALLRYQPRPYPNRLFLVANEDWHRQDPTLGWGGVAAGGIETHVLPPGHAVLRPDRVEATAERVRACLAAAEAATAP